MDLGDVVEIVGGLEAADVTVWVDGGWCVDALVGRQLRDHDDLDIAVDRAGEQALRDWLEDRGYTERCDPQDTATNFVYQDGDGRSIDVHVFGFDADGSPAYGVPYPRESLTGRASLGGIPIHCIPPEWMFRFKTEYPPRPKDLIDVQALADAFGFTVPPSHEPW